MVQVRGLGKLNGAVRKAGIGEPQPTQGVEGDPRSSERLRKRDAQFQHDGLAKSNVPYTAWHYQCETDKLLLYAERVDEDVGRGRFLSAHKSQYMGE
jgi:hypothetical protein